MANKPRKKLSAKNFTILISSLLALLIAFAIALPAVTVTQFDEISSVRRAENPAVPTPTIRRTLTKFTTRATTTA